jgi:hypothetical protein
MADTAEFHAQRDEMESTVYEGITNLIQKAYNAENPRGRNATSLAVHSAMARVMADVCTDRKVEVVCEIEQSFVENWALTHFLMKDKQDHFMRYGQCGGKPRPSASCSGGESHGVFFRKMIWKHFF